MNKYKRLGKNTFLVFIGNTGSKLIALVMLPFYTSWLSVEDYGVTDIINVYVSFLVSIVSCCIAESIFIFNPKDQFFARAESTAEILSIETPDCKVSVFDLEDEAKLKEEVANADILVNATLAGMKPHEELTLIKDKSMFRPDLVVADVVYNPAETRMVKEAKEAGCKLAIGGKGMLLWQGAAAYKLYTGLEMPTAEYQKFQEENENK